MTKKVGKDTIKKLIEEALDLSTPLKFTKKPNNKSQYDDSVKDLKFKSSPVGLGASSGRATRFMKALFDMIVKNEKAILKVGQFERIYKRLNNACRNQDEYPAKMKALEKKHKKEMEEWRKTGIGLVDPRGRI